MASIACAICGRRLLDGSGDLGIFGIEDARDLSDERSRGSGSRDFFARCQAIAVSVAPLLHTLSTLLERFDDAIMYQWSDLANTL